MGDGEKEMKKLVSQRKPIQGGIIRSAGRRKIVK